MAVKGKGKGEFKTAGQKWPKGITLFESPCRWGRMHGNSGPEPPRVGGRSENDRIAAFAGDLQKLRQDFFPAD